MSKRSRLITQQALAMLAPTVLYDPVCKHRVDCEDYGRLTMHLAEKYHSLRLSALTRAAESK